MGLPHTARAGLAFLSFSLMHAADRHSHGNFYTTALRDTSYVICALLAGSMPDDSGGGILARLFISVGITGGDTVAHSRETGLLATIFIMQLLRVVMT